MAQRSLTQRLVDELVRRADELDRRRAQGDAPASVAGLSGRYRSQAEVLAGMSRGRLPDFARELANELGLATPPRSAASGST